MFAGMLNLLVVPLGTSPDGVLLGIRLFGYVGDNSFLMPDLAAISRYYLEGGANFLVVGAAAFAVTAGARDWGRWVAVALMLMVLPLFLLATLGRYVSIDNALNPGEQGAIRLTAIVLLAVAIFVAVSLIALLVRGYPISDGLAVAAPVLLAGLHLWSLSQLVAEPESGLRLNLLVWTPAGWFLLTALGALFAAVGAVDSGRVTSYPAGQQR